MNKREKNEICEPMTVDITSLMSMLNVGKSTATKIGDEANAVIKVGRRKLFNVQRIREYMNSITGKGEQDYD